MKLLVDKVFSLGTNKHIGSKPVIKRVIFIFASIIKCLSIDVIKKDKIQSASPQSYSTEELKSVCPVMRFCAQGNTSVKPSFPRGILTCFGLPLNFLNNN